MKKILKLSFRAILILLLLVILSLVIAGYWANNFIQQQSQEQKLELLHWQMPKLESHQLSLEQLNFRYQNNYQIDIRGLKVTTQDELIHITKKFANNIFTQDSPSDSSVSRPSISQLSIDRISIQILKPIEQTTNEQQKPIKIHQLLESLQRQLRIFSQKNTHTLIPQSIQVHNLSIALPCPAQTQKHCEVFSKLNAQFSLNHEELRGQLKIKANDIALPELTLNSEMTFALALNQAPDFLQFSSNHQISYPDTFHLNLLAQTQTDANQNKLQLNTELRGKFPQTHKINKDQFAFTKNWQTLIDLYHRWSPVPSNDALIATQITPFLPAGDFLSEQTEFHFSSQTQAPVTSIFKVSLNDLVTLELPTEFSAQINRPVTVPRIASVSGSFKGKVYIQNNQLTGYAIQAKALATDLIKPEWFKQQGWQTDALEIHLQSEQQIRNNEPLQIPFKLSLLGLPKTEAKTSTLELDAKGLVSLDETPSLKVDKAHLEFSQPELKLNPNILLTNTQAKTNFTAQFTLKDGKTDRVKERKIDRERDRETDPKISGEIKIQQATASTQLRDKQQTLELNKLKIDQLTVQIPEFTRFTDTLEFKAKKLTLNGHYRSPDIGLQNFTTSVNNLHLQTDQQQRKTLSANHQTTIKTLKHTLLKSQGWQTTGNLSANFKEIPTSINALQSIKLKGELQNTAGIHADYLANFSPKQLTVDWSLADQYLLAGNPIKKTVVNWPKLFSLSSGKLAANGTISMNPQTILSNKDTPLLETLKAQSNLELSGIDGIYNETAFSQLALKAHLKLEKAQLKSNIETFKIEQLNHGLIVGPIDVVAQTQTPINNWLGTLIQLQKAEVGVFEGKAHLDSKIIYLDQDIHGKLRLEDVNLQALLLQYPTAELHGTGRLQGDLPFSLNLTNRSQQKPILQITNGEVSASKAGGVLQYQADSTGLKKVHKSMEVHLTVLEDFHYKVLDSQISLDEQQKLRLKLRLEGNNPKVEQGRQVNLNIQIEEDLPALITSMQISNQINSTIQQRIQEKLQRERGLKPTN